VPNETTADASSSTASSQIALMNVPGAMGPRSILGGYMSVTVEDSCIEAVTLFLGLYSRICG
jgi:hypothetical protein